MSTKEEFFRKHSVIPFKKAAGTKASLLQSALVVPTRDGLAEFSLTGMGFNRDFHTFGQVEFVAQ